MTTATNTVGNAAASALSVTTTVITSTDGLGRISEFALSIFALIEHIYQSIPEAINTVGKALKGFVEMTGVIALFKRCRDWFLPDEDGVMLIEKAWQQVVSIACLTASNIAGFINLLATTLKMFTLGAALAPLNIAGGIMAIGSSVFDLCHQINILREVSEQIEKAERAKAKWAARAKIFASGNKPRGWEALVQKQITLWTNREAKYRASGDVAKQTHAIIYMSEWTTVASCSDIELKHISDQKVVNLETELTNHTNAKIKAWVNVALNISYIVLGILTTIAAFIMPPASMVLATLICGIVFSGIDLSGYIVEECLKKKPVPVGLIT